MAYHQLLKVRGLAGVNQPCHGNTFGVTGHGSHVIPGPRVVVIYWDQYFTDTPAAVTVMNQFITDLVTGTYIDGLGQYGVGRGSFQGSVVINMATYPTPNSQNPGVAFSESQMQAQLVTWLDRGVVTPDAGRERNLPRLSHPGPQRYHALVRRDHVRVLRLSPEREAQRLRLGQQFILGYGAGLLAVVLWTVICRFHQLLRES